MKPLRIGTRGSALALWQANHIADRLRTHHPDLTVELIEIQTVGDVVRDAPLVQLGGTGIFTKAIQDALLENKADVAVHSLKDLPTFAVAGLVLACVPERAPTGDALVSVRHRSFDALPPGAVVATSSQRRKAQLLHRRPDLELVEIRGNVDTRLRKLREQNLDATILAEAGLLRLGLHDQITQVLDADWMLPAVGQGALGLECRQGDADTRARLRPLDHARTHAAVLAERAFLRALQGGCQVPIGAFAIENEGTLHLRGVVLSADGRERIEGSDQASPDQAETLGQRLADDLKPRGAARLMEG